MEDTAVEDDTLLLLWLPSETPDDDEGDGDAEENEDVDVEVVDCFAASSVCCCLLTIFAMAEFAAVVALTGTGGAGRRGRLPKELIVLDE